MTWEMMDTNDLVPTLNDIEQSGTVREVKFIIHHPVPPSFALGPVQRQSVQS